MKLIQKHFIKGMQEFELGSDDIRVRIKTPFKEKQISVVLSTLNPEPVVNKSRLEFYGRVKCGPMLSLYRDKPNKEDFNAFVEALKKQALKEYNGFLGVKGE
jgi:hypothetical protein